MRYFRYYQDDTMTHPSLSNHDAYASGYLVNRRPVIVDFNQLKHKRSSAMKASWAKKAKQLARRMA